MPPTIFSRADIMGIKLPSPPGMVRTWTEAMILMISKQEIPLTGMIGNSKMEIIPINKPKFNPEEVFRNAAIEMLQQVPDSHQFEQILDATKFSPWFATDHDKEPGRRAIERLFELSKQITHQPEPPEDQASQIGDGASQLPGWTIIE